VIAYPEHASNSERSVRGRLAGKVALVTGASSGIGAATVRRLAAEGARVALVARRADVLDAMVADIGDSVLAVAADVSDPDSAREAIRSATSHFGGLDIVVNSAGVCEPAALADADPGSWRRHIDVNLSGSYYVAREGGLMMMAAEGGTILNVGSELSTIGMATYAAYCASKAGIIGLTRALAAELAPKVTVNAICPGPVDTPMLAAEFERSGNGNSELVRTEALERVPLGRFATAAEVADGILYLVADAPFATGATLQLDGGTTAI
jgi:NAD(P)-dependent dehydrogenase (short-subunit alcohol dehydrogenase family)